MSLQPFWTLARKNIGAILRWAAVLVTVSLLSFADNRYVRADSLTTLEQRVKALELIPARLELIESWRTAQEKLQEKRDTKVVELGDKISDLNARQMEANAILREMKENQKDQLNRLFDKVEALQKRQ